MLAGSTMAPRRSTRSTRAADAKDKEKQSEEVVVQPEADAVPGKCCCLKGEQRERQMVIHCSFALAFF